MRKIALLESFGQELTILNITSAQASCDEGEYEKTASLAGQGVGWV
jgi:hypothetical protein